MASVAKTSGLTPEIYLAQERLAPTKSEFDRGQIYQMAGASLRHLRIVGNLFVELHTGLRGTPCHAFTGDLRVAVEPVRFTTYPDLTVVCGEPQLLDRELDTLLNPSLIIEVLSPSTEKWDRGGKFARYRRIESLREYVLVSQHQPLIEHYARQGEQWVLTVVSYLGHSLQLALMDGEIPLREIYADVPFDTDEIGADR